MTTTTSTTSSTSTAATTASTTTAANAAKTSTASIIGNATQALLTSLNTGSGIDTSSLVTSLVQAQFAAQNAALTAKNAALTAQISAVSTLKSTITNFSTALSTLTTSGSLQTQPLSSNANALTATAIAGQQVGTMPSSITVNALASAQGARTTTAIADRSATIGSGTLTLTLGTATYGSDGTTMTGFTAGSATPAQITITNGSLDGIASAINGANAGVTASVVTDVDGKAYLSLKGATGAAQAFTLNADSSSSPLAQFNVGIGAPTALTGTAANASLTIDGVTVQRASNTVTDLVSGVKLQLTGTGTSTMSTTRPTSAISQAVSDFVDTYNQVYGTLKDDLDAANGPLKTDSAAKSLLRSLQSLTTKTLVSTADANAPKTLAQIGIGTNRDGTLSVDSATLNRALANYPDAVEAMFAPTTINGIGLQSTFSSISLAAASSTTGLGASSAAYTKAQSDLSAQQDKLSQQSDAMTTRMTQQFASMNAKVSAYKSTQTFLENQIKAWNGSNN